MSGRKKIVITGASGFLGSHLVKALKDDERYEVLALTSGPDELKRKLGGENAEYVHKDALSAEMFKDAVVINCAYPRNSTGTACADGLKYIQRVFETAVEGGASAIVNISSQSVYSQQRTEAAAEDTPVCLESPYAVGKYAVELMLESICRGSDTRYTNLRMASLIGPGFDQRIVNRFVKQAMETGVITAKKNQQKFGFFDVEDAVDGLIAIINSNAETWNAVYNLGGNGACTIIDIAQTVREMLKGQKQINVTYEDEEKSGNTCVDASLFCHCFNYKPACGLERSVGKIIDNYDEPDSLR